MYLDAGESSVRYFPNFTREEFPKREQQQCGEGAAPSIIASIGRAVLAPLENIMSEKELSVHANKSLKRIKVHKPTPTTPCGVILTSCGEDGIARVRKLEESSLLRAAGVAVSDLLLDVDGATGGAIAMAYALRHAYGDFELLVKRPRFPNASRDAPAWCLDVSKEYADQPLESLVLLTTWRCVTEVYGGARSLDVMSGDLLLCVDNTPVQNKQEAEEAWDKAEVGNVRCIVEAGPQRRARLDKAQPAPDVDNGDEDEESATGLR